MKEGEPIKADIYNVMIKSVKQSSCLSNRRHKVALEQNDRERKNKNRERKTKTGREKKQKK